jgi:hypothetical protein
MPDYAKLLNTWNKTGRPRTFEVNHVTYLHEDSLEGPQFKPIGDNALTFEREFLSEQDKIARQDQNLSKVHAAEESLMMSKITPPHNSEPVAPEDEKPEEPAEEEKPVVQSPTGHATAGKVAAKPKAKAKE